MAFVKLHRKMLDSSLWMDMEAREIFITALLMAEPKAVDEPLEALQADEIAPLGFTVPPGPYGFVAVAGIALCRRAGLSIDAGMAALARLSDPDPHSRTKTHDGRRMVRIEDGFVILNYDKYRVKDETAAERMRRYRQRQKEKEEQEQKNRYAVTDRNVTQQGRHVTQVEEEEEVEEEVEEINPPSPPRGDLSPAVQSEDPPPAFRAKARAREIFAEYEKNRTASLGGNVTKFTDDHYRAMQQTVRYIQQERGCDEEAAWDWLEFFGKAAIDEAASPKNTPEWATKLRRWRTGPPAWTKKRYQSVMAIVDSEPTETQKGKMNGQKRKIKQNDIDGRFYFTDKWGQRIWCDAEGNPA